jgi:CheY-like chemotaxis protein/sRNA-binding carbon storage regulator CsrA
MGTEAQPTDFGRLVISRKLGEEISLPQVEARIAVEEVRGSLYRIKVIAPKDIVVLRSEVSNTKHGQPFTRIIQELRAARHKLANEVNAAQLSFDLLANAARNSPETLPSLVLEMRDSFDALLEEMDHAECRPAKAPKAIIIEDNAFERELLASTLRLMGADVLAVGTGEEAIEILREGEEADVVLLDMCLPGASGREVARQIRELSLSHRPRICVVSGCEKEDNDDVDQWVTKPIKHEALAQGLGVFGRVG